MTEKVPEKGATPKATPRNRWSLAAAAIAGVGMGATTMVLLGGRSAASPNGKSAAGISAVSTLNAAPARLPSAPADRDDSSQPKWSGSRKTQWARDGSKTITFQLEAENDVPVWMKRVRPVLAVRCLFQRTEVFVMPGSAASIEVNDRHTVRVGFDQGPDTADAWLDSADSQQLFATDGIRLARQIAGAQTMRFGFTPFNAAPVLVEFDVRGFDGLVGLVAKTCDWKP